MTTIRDLLYNAVDDARQEIIAAISDKGLRASGRTQASLTIVQPDSYHITLYGRQAFEVLEAGRRPGRVPHNFVGIIRQWIIDKGIPVRAIPYKRKASANWSPKYTPIERGLQSMAGAIAHKIRTEGTSLFRAGGRSDIYSPAIERAIKTIEDGLDVLLNAQINHLTIHKS